jgi:hypothetical protein
MLFHHYVTWIAPLMIPVDGAENPWKSVYPSTALRSSSTASRALYHAILAQSAFNIANLHGDNGASSRHKDSVALKHYGASLSNLRQGLSVSTEEEYDACAATLYTLMISEVGREWPLMPQQLANSPFFLLYREMHEAQSPGEIILTASGDLSVNLFKRSLGIAPQTLG